MEWLPGFGRKSLKKKVDDDDSVFKVFIYDKEYQKIQEWVSKYPHIETGGDLFGLWLDETTAVVQLVLGPGENCRRTSASFFQDLEYLERVGNLLTTKEGLCHIGEWHSHHTLGLTKPSGGDERTVWSNMERYGLHRFFLFIATITGPKSDDVGVKCFLFDTTNQPDTHQSGRHWSNWNVQEGGFKFMKGESPFRFKLKEKLDIGSEVQKTKEDMEKFDGSGSVKSNERFKDKKTQRVKPSASESANERPKNKKASASGSQRKNADSAEGESKHKTGKKH